VRLIYLLDYRHGAKYSCEGSVPHIHIFFMNRLTAMPYPGGSREQYRYDAICNPVGYDPRRTSRAPSTPGAC
jgi:hypothetical protein